MYTCNRKNTDCGGDQITKGKYKHFISENSTVHQPLMNTLNFYFILGMWFRYNGAVMFTIM